MVQSKEYLVRSFNRRCCFFVFHNKIGLGNLLLLISNANKPLVLLVVLLNSLNLTSFTMTWRFLISASISPYKLFKFYTIGAFINNITPAFGTGGEPVKAILLGEETGISQAECFASVVSQRLLNMLPFLIIGGSWCWISVLQTRNHSWDMGNIGFSTLYRICLWCFWFNHLFLYQER